MVDMSLNPTKPNQDASSDPIHGEKGMLFTSICKERFISPTQILLLIWCCTIDCFTCVQSINISLIFGTPSNC